MVCGYYIAEETAAFRRGEHFAMLCHIRRAAA
jgi:hypothetical protein